MATQLAELKSVATYIGFDKNTERHIYLYKFNAEQFNQLASLNHKTGKTEFINGMYILEEGNIRKINSVKWSQALKLYAFNIDACPLLTHELELTIKANLNDDELTPFKIILSNQLYKATDAFRIDRKKSIENFKYYNSLIKDITNTNPRISEGKIIVSAKDLMMVHAYTGINPNKFFTSRSIATNNLDWTGIHKFKLQ